MTIDRRTMRCPECGETITVRQLTRHQNGEPCRKRRWNHQMQREGFVSVGMHSRLREIFDAIDIECRSRPPVAKVIFWAPEWAVRWVDHFQRIEASDAATVALLACGLRLMKADPRLRAIVFSLLAVQDETLLNGGSHATRYMLDLQCPQCLGSAGLNLPAWTRATHGYIVRCDTCNNTGRKPERRELGTPKTNAR